jgi:chromosome segregation ATPase
MSLFGRRERREIRELNAYVDRLREQRDKALAERDTATYNREQIIRQFADADADADAANRRLMGRNLELGRRLSVLTEADPEYAATLERRVARLLKVIARLYAVSRAERLRADRLQRRLDDAVGLASPRPLDSSVWQPGYVAPKPDKETTP